MHEILIACRLVEIAEDIEFGNRRGRGGDDKNQGCCEDKSHKINGYIIL